MMVLVVALPKLGPKSLAIKNITDQDMASNVITAKCLNIVHIFILLNQAAQSQTQKVKANIV